jgi:hypothetical protein
MASSEGCVYVGLAGEPLSLDGIELGFFLTKGRYDAAAVFRAATEAGTDPWPLVAARWPEPHSPSSSSGTRNWSGDSRLHEVQARRGSATAKLPEHSRRSHGGARSETRR